MSSLFGSFVLVKREKIYDFALHILGSETAEKVEGFYLNESTFYISISDDDKLHYSYTVEDKKIENKCSFNEEFDENTFFGKTVKTVVTKYSDTQFNYVSTTFDGKKFTRSYVLSPESATITFAAPQFGLTATMVYKRV